VLRFRSALALIGALSFGGSATASSQVAGFSCRFVMIPMRDGVRLNTSVCEPKGTHPPVPILITRTPYGVAGDTMVRTDYRFLAADGYAFVFQDIRGRYKSEGQFYMNRPLHAASDTKGTDESTDTYDTVAWLLKNVPGNNGRVVIMPGLYTEPESRAAPTHDPACAQYGITNDKNQTGEASVTVTVSN